MNKKTLLALCLLTLSSSVLLTGCGDDETKPDPKIAADRDAQRAAQQPGGAPPAPNGAAPGTEGK